jgi:adenylosuccinate synthase
MTSRGWSESPNLSVVGLQWGDEGKGKVVDYLAGPYDAVVRFNGGSNAGHTVVIGDRRHTFHLVPSGALKGKDLMVGPGVVVDPEVLSEERALLPDSVKRKLIVDGRCSLVSPFDKELDTVLEAMRGSAPIGTTRRGIGPAYAARALRLSPRVSDVVAGFEFGPLREFYGKFGIDSAGIVAWAEDSRRLLAELTGNVGSKVIELCDSGGSMLYESSQGTLLDLFHGSYPFVTSTHTVSTYVPSSLGIPPAYGGEPLGVMKCYTTRVGGGPFPTEEKGPAGDVIRSIGNEYGTTTGRPRRVGWLDLVGLRYAVRLNGVKNVAVSKLDVLSAVDDFRVCVAYRISGSETEDFQRSLGQLGDVQPVYETPFQLHGADFGGGLPHAGRKFVDYVESRLGVRVSILSHGEERSRTIEL